MTVQDMTIVPAAAGAMQPSQLFLLVGQARAALALDPQSADAHLSFLENLLAPFPSDRGPGATVQSGGLSPWQLGRVKRHIEERLGERLSTADLAEVAKLSCGHFCRAFKTSTGVSPHAYIIGRRLARAQALMQGTDEPLSQIALMCGLADQAHLSRLFRRGLGCSPSRWRRLTSSTAA